MDTRKHHQHYRLTRLISPFRKRPMSCCPSTDLIDGLFQPDGGSIGLLPFSSRYCVGLPRLPGIEIYDCGDRCCCCNPMTIACNQSKPARQKKVLSPLNPLIDSAHSLQILGATNGLPKKESECVFTFCWKGGRIIGELVSALGICKEEKRGKKTIKEEKRRLIIFSST